MDKPRSAGCSHILAGVLGAVAGGIAAVVATRAIPTMLSRMVSGAMQNTMMRMGGEGCDREEK